MNTNQNSPNDVRDYLRVDSFLQNFIHARALRSAFEIGLIARLQANGGLSCDDLGKQCDVTPEGLGLLLDLLTENGVVEGRAAKIKLQPEFSKALRYADLMTAKLEFAHLVTPDFAGLLTTLLQRPDRFAKNARIFDLFGYNRCIEYSPENFELTRQWMGFTTTLTKYEAPVCLQYYDFRRHRRLLDIGGNSGEFARRACQRHPALHATIFDLPLVCDIGRQHVAPAPEAARIEFIKGNAFEDELPLGYDLITFKSMLHDWPEKEAQSLLAKAAGALAPGGTLLIFERGPLATGNARQPYAMLPMLLFFRSFRRPQVYTDCLEQLGFRNVTVQQVDLESPFFIITADKPSG